MKKAAQIALMGLAGLVAGCAVDKRMHNDPAQVEQPIFRKEIRESYTATFEGKNLTFTSTSRGYDMPVGHSSTYSVRDELRVEHPDGRVIIYVDTWTDVSESIDPNFTKMFYLTEEISKNTDGTFDFRWGHKVQPKRVDTHCRVLYHEDPTIDDIEVLKDGKRTEYVPSIDELKKGTDEYKRLVRKVRP